MISTVHHDLQTLKRPFVKNKQIICGFTRTQSSCSICSNGEKASNGENVKELQIYLMFQINFTSRAGWENSSCHIAPTISHPHVYRRTTYVRVTCYACMFVCFWQKNARVKFCFKQPLAYLDCSCQQGYAYSPLSTSKYNFQGWRYPNLNKT